MDSALTLRVSRHTDAPSLLPRLRHLVPAVRKKLSRREFRGVINEKALFVDPLILSRLSHEVVLVRVMYFVHGMSYTAAVVTLFRQ